MAKLGALLHNVTIQLASHLNLLYIVEFSFKSNSFQWRSICVFGIYIQVILREFFVGPNYPRQGIFQMFSKFLLNLFRNALCE